MWSKVSLALGLVIVVIVSGFYWYFSWSQTQLTTLRENNAKLELAVKTNEDAIKSLQQDYATANAEISRVNTELSDARMQNRQLQDRLSRHEIGALAESKPGLVENIVNNASDKAARCFELLSGAELTDKERAAKNGKEFNSECPWMYDTLSIAN